MAESQNDPVLIGAALEVLCAFIRRTPDEIAAEFSAKIKSGKVPVAGMPWQKVRVAGAIIDGHVAFCAHRCAQDPR
jgi:hypothetical protein